MFVPLFDIHIFNIRIDVKNKFINANRKISVTISITIEHITAKSMFSIVIM